MRMHSNKYRAMTARPRPHGSQPPKADDPNRLLKNDTSVFEGEDGSMERTQLDDIIEEMNIRIRFFIYLFDQKDKLVVTDIDGTITKSDTRGFFGGNLGYSVHHASVNEFFDKVYSNGYKVMYLTARPIAYQSLTRTYLFESLSCKDPNNWKLPKNPVFCLPGNTADAALGDSSKGAEGKTTSLKNVLGLFKEPGNVIVGAYGNNNSDSEAYKNVGVPLSMTYLIDKQSKMVNLETKQETSFKAQATEINTLYPNIND